jgi:5-methylthioribose kinase
MFYRRSMRESSNLNCFDDAEDRLEGYILQQAASILRELGRLDPLPVGHCGAAMHFVVAQMEGLPPLIPFAFHAQIRGVLRISAQAA